MRTMVDSMTGTARRVGTRRALGGGMMLAAGGLLALAVVPFSAASAGDSSARDATGFAAELAAAGVSDAANGRATGRRMAAKPAMTPIAQAPERAFLDRIATIGAAEDIEAALRRAGVPASQARSASAAVRAAAGDRTIARGTRMALRLGKVEGGGMRPLEKLSLRAGMDMDIALALADGTYRVTRDMVDVTTEPMRIAGKVGSGLYWSLRSAGLAPSAVQAYLEAVSAQVDMGEISAGDRFDVVVERRRTAEGQESVGPLLYAGLDRTGGSDVTLVKWRTNSGERWIAPTDLDAAENAMAWPVSARISSRFGMRRHPILRYKRMHNGIDFAAAHGTPIHAAADGVVNRAGWAGGYGKQVRLSHSDGLTTSYSHMSTIAVANGTPVRQGDVIGYVGSTGMSTGAHLHYEVRQGGRAVDPMSVRMMRQPLLGREERRAFEARLAEYRALPTS